MKKRILALVLLAVIAVSMVPVSGLAATFFDCSFYIGNVYLNVLGREVDQPSHKHWMDQLWNNRVITGKEFAYEIITSQEYINKNTSNATYITNLYAGFLGRYPNNAEMTHWLTQIIAIGRMGVFYDIINSPESEASMRLRGIL